MPFVNDIGKTLRNLAVYLSGRGFITLAVITAGMIAAGFGGGILLPTLVATGGGVLLTSFMTLRSQGQFEQEMVNLYRDEIAASLNIAPSQVTRAHLPQAAEHNDVIAQALTNRQHKTSVNIITKSIAGVVAFGAIMLGFGPIVAGWVAESGMSALLGNIVQFSGTALIAGLSSLIVHDGLKVAFDNATGISQATAHDNIRHIDHLLSHGRTISKEQVYAVVVAGSPELAQNIRRRFGESYSSMNTKERRAVIDAFNLAPEMERITQAINSHELAPAKLAYIVGDVRSDLSHINQQREESAAPERSFIERLNLASRENKSHVERIEQTVATALQR